MAAPEPPRAPRAGMPPHIHQLGGAVNLHVDLSTSQLDAFHRKHRTPHWAGAFASDQLPANPTGKCLISNYDPSSKGGSHWIAMDFRGGEGKYFDSFAFSPDGADNILHDETSFGAYMRAHSPGGVFSSNTHELQCRGDDQCGVYASYFLLHGLPSANKPAWASLMRGACKARDIAVQTWWDRGGAGLATF